MRLRYCNVALVSRLLEVCDDERIEAGFLRALLDLRYEILKMNVKALDGVSREE